MSLGSIISALALRSVYNDGAPLFVAAVAGFLAALAILFSLYLLITAVTAEVK